MEDDHVQGGVVLQVHAGDGGRTTRQTRLYSELGLTGRVAVIRKV